MAKLPVINPTACAVAERTGNGDRVGRCWFNVVDDMCPRHGNVKKVQEHYKATGQLTDEWDLEIHPTRRKPRT